MRYAWLPRDTIICLGDSFVLKAKSVFGNYIWDNGGTMPSRLIKREGNYTINISWKCGNISDHISVQLGNDCICTLYIPTAFSPNEDALNENWKPILCSKPKSYYMQVYNRWGERVFFSDDIDKG